MIVYVPGKDIASGKVLKLTWRAFAFAEEEGALLCAIHQRGFCLHPTNFAVEPAAGEEAVCGQGGKGSHE